MQMHFVMHTCLLAAHDGELWQWALKCCKGAGCVNLVLNVGGRNKHDSVERPRRWTRNPLGSARRGSNPLAVGCLLQRCVAWERERRKGSGAIARNHCLVSWLVSWRHASLPCLCSGSIPDGRICLAAIREGVLLKREFAPTWKRPALVGWEEWGKRQTGNGKGKHEVAGPV